MREPLDLVNTSPMASKPRGSDRPLRSITHLFRSRYTCVMKVGSPQNQEPQSHYSVERAASALGVSQRRVRKLLAHGQLDGHREGHIWLVARKSVAARANRRQASSRSLAPHSMSVLVDLIGRHLGGAAGEAWQQAEPIDRLRARRRVERLVQHEEPAALLRAWAAPDHVREVRASDELARSILEWDGVVVSGASHPISSISPSMELEVHAPERRARRIEQEADGGRIKILIHSPKRPWSIGEVPVDLALRNGSREDDDVRRLLAGAR